ncbi:glycoside hydrolase family 97 protein, partial [bacterium]|nr:glycoside hydrolase family 97 protein [bacterium]
MNRIIIAAIIMLTVSSGYATPKTVNMKGPDGRIKVSFTLDKAGQPAYSVSYLDTAVIPNGALGLKRKDADFSKGLRLISVTGPETVNESYTLLY